MLIFGIRIAARPLTWQALWVGEKKKKLITIILVVANPLRVYHCILVVDLDFGNLERFTICTSSAK